MSDTVNLIVSTTETRNEIQVPVELIQEEGVAPSNTLLSFLRESEVRTPTSPMITKNESGYLLHETPSFG